uniref:GPI inositol-deacylase n=1 Tax=Photinus pyralis TaxID=7054 RepID=A0A1Y1N8T0_PHOPY
MGVVSGFILSSVIVTLAYLFGILIFLKDHEVNRCEMTYMYEYPQFVHIKLDTDHRFRKYGLYAYSEGRFTYNARNMKFTGIPILFIPGNAGSYRQVRSLASVCLRKSLDDRSGFHFDFFAVNLNNEFSGLNGALLQEQTEYVNKSVYQILELYPKTRPKNIVLFGHSMGGVIARGLLTVLDNSIVPLIITLAAPHSRPPLMLDSYMLDYYHRIRTVNKAVNSTIVSLSGGYNDYLITPFITTARYLDSLHVFSPSVPLVWLPMDHLCILWCKQLVLVIARGLFDAVDFNTKQMSHDPEFLRAVFYHHLVNNNGIKIRKSIQSSHLTQSVMFARGRSEWIENLQKQYTISLAHGVQQMQYHMLRILGDTDYRYLTIVALNVDVVEWVFACSATQLQEQRRICSDGIHLSHFTEIWPSIRYRRKLLKLDTQELKRHYTELTHVIVRLLPTSKPVVIQIDRYFEPDRKLTVKTPSWFSFQRQLLLNQTHEKSLYYEIIMPQLTHVIQVYKVYVDLIKCSSKVHHATASLKVPWGNQNTHKHFTEEDIHPFQIRLHNSRPINGVNESASLQLTLDPLCQYSVSSCPYGFFGNEDIWINTKGLLK